MTQLDRIEKNQKVIARALTCLLSELPYGTRTGNVRNELREIYERKAN